MSELEEWKKECRNLIHKELETSYAFAKLKIKSKKLVEALEYIAGSCPGPEESFENENKLAAKKALTEWEAAND